MARFFYTPMHEVTPKLVTMAVRMVMTMFRILLQMFLYVELNDWLIGDEYRGSSKNKCGCANLHTRMLLSIALFAGHDVEHKSVCFVHTLRTDAGKIADTAVHIVIDDTFY